jgi:glutathione S-transferase
VSARYTLILGTKNWSSWSLRAYLALRATGAVFEEVVIRLRQPDTRANIRKYVPSDMVPALRIAEGDQNFTVFDSLAICETLAERHPEAGLWPDDPSARACARSISAAMHSGFAALRASLPMEFAQRLATPELSAEVKEQIATIVRFWEEAHRNHGGRDGFLFGRLTIADCMYAPVVSRFRTYGIPLGSALDSYCNRMFDLPAMRDWMDASQREVDGGLV